MANFRIVTNNPNVERRWEGFAERVEGGVAQVFARVRDEVHLGAVLISHPLAGSLKPNENPYKSIAVSVRREALDEKSLMTIEDAMVTLVKLPIKKRDYPQGVLEDFMAIDEDLVASCMAALPAEYHS